MCAHREGQDGWQTLWEASIPMTGKGLVVAENALIVAGEPAFFPPDHSSAKCLDAYEGRLGGRPVINPNPTSFENPRTPMSLGTARCYYYPLN